MMTQHIAAAAIAENDDGELLMVQEGKDHIEGTWDFPGGGLEEYETIEECARREFIEETGYKVSLKHPIGIYFEESVRTGNTVAVFTFKAVVKEKCEEKLDNGEIMDEKFFGKEEIESLNLRKENRLKMLRDYKKGDELPDSSLVETRDINSS